MLLIKRTSAWEELCDLVDKAAQKGEETGTPLFNLYDAVSEADKYDALDNVISYEFPNGVEIEELEEFFTEEQDYIFDALGISRDADEDYEDSDEESED